MGLCWVKILTFQISSSFHPEIVSAVLAGGPDRRRDGADFTASHNSLPLHAWRPDDVTVSPNCCLVRMAF